MPPVGEPQVAEPDVHRLVMGIDGEEQAPWTPAVVGVEQGCQGGPVLRTKEAQEAVPGRGIQRRKYSWEPEKAMRR